VNPTSTATHRRVRWTTPQSTPATPDERTDGDGWLHPPGEALYKDYCLNCHGADAKGGVTMRPIDAEPMNVHTMHIRSGTHPGEFANRREYMPKWTAAELTDAEIRMIFMYVSDL
jgi:mono/diheme cytochrome c family protein